MFLLVCDLYLIVLVRWHFEIKNVRSLLFFLLVYDQMVYSSIFHYLYFACLILKSVVVLLVDFWSDVNALGGVCWYITFFDVLLLLIDFIFYLFSINLKCRLLLRYVNVYFRSSSCGCRTTVGLGINWKRHDLSVIVWIYVVDCCDIFAVGIVTLFWPKVLVCSVL